MEKYILLPLYLLLTTSGMVLIKLGGSASSFTVKDGGFVLGMSFLSLIGFICYIASFLIFIRIISIYNLSYIYPICVGIVQVLTLIASYTIFKEKLTYQGIIGALVIIIGIVIMNINQK